MTHDGLIPPRAARVLVSLPGLLAITLLIGVVSLNRQSFWIDEFGTWFLARSGGPLEWLRVFIGTTDSDGQIVLYHFAVYLWSKLAGLGELSLRGVNVVFLGVAIVVLGRSAWLTVEERALLIVLMGLNAFVIGYMNEARQYILLLCGASLLLAGSLQNAAFLASNDTAQLDRSLRLLILGSIVSVGATAVSGVFAVAVLLANVVSWRPAHWREAVQSLRRQVPFLAVAVVVSAAIAALILYSVAKGSKPSTLNTTSLATIAFGLMETFGAAGYLPGRADLRQGAASAIRPWQWAAVGSVMLVYGALALLGVVRSRSRVLVAVAVATAAAVALVALSGYVIGYRVLGRHFSFVVPVASAFAAIGLASLHGPIRTVAAAALVVLLVGSSASIRLAERHAKEDFDTALAMTSRTVADGRSVWWMGDARALAFRDIPYLTLEEALASPGRTGVVVHLPDGQAVARSQALSDPSLLIMQRPEQNDPDGAVRTALARRGLGTERTLNGLVALTGAGR